MQPLDWMIVAAYFLVSAAIGLAYTRRAGKNVSEFFVSGRSLPWWLAGTSMVATTFAADTPLAVAGMVVILGIIGKTSRAGSTTCSLQLPAARLSTATRRPLSILP